MKDCPKQGRIYDDSDVYKWIEAAALDSVSNPDPELKTILNEVINLIAASQDGDGYLNTAFMFERKSLRWRNLTDEHELYCGGHLIQAAIAVRRASGENVLFDSAVKWADHVRGLFGAGKRPGAPGHPEVEMALVELYRETGDKKYLDQAQLFIENRGLKPPVLNGRGALQDHLPIREQTCVRGHAVRQLYLMSGVADVFAETGDDTLFEVIDKQWENFTWKRMAVTGGAGARYEGEAFGGDYELPNRASYNETCAAIAAFMLHWRMLLLTGGARFADAMELALYNGLLSGMALDGKSYFYTNPLEHSGGEDLAGDFRGSNRRTTGHWDHTACCPPNMARLLASLPGYLFGTGDKGIYIHHFAAGSLDAEIDGAGVRINIQTSYPWGGNVLIELAPERETEFSLWVRIPGWCRAAAVKINGQAADSAPVPGTYMELRRPWNPGDEVKVNLPMDIRRIAAHPRITENAGCLAIMRGPIVYCVEEADHPGMDIFNLVLPIDSKLEPRFREEMLGGVVVLEGQAFLRSWPGNLYLSESGDFGDTILNSFQDKDFGDTILNSFQDNVNAEIDDRIKYGVPEIPEIPVKLTMIPYYSWANRTPGAMRLWLPCC